MFQFPSNGKADTKIFSVVAVLQRMLCVSIPFKREGGYKVIPLAREILANSGCVSIPFKREGGYKGHAKCQRRRFILFSFNSLQTGRRIQRRENGIHTEKHLEFQFPSNGKADTKSFWTQTNSAASVFVSIPFKREGGYKVWWYNRHRLRHYGFNSLQTGRRIQRNVKNFLHCDSIRAFVSIPFKREGGYKEELERIYGTDVEMFQFPSNGKADTKVFLFLPSMAGVVTSFNSLQTGRRIQSRR